MTCMGCGAELQYDMIARDLAFLSHPLSLPGVLEELGCRWDHNTKLTNGLWGVREGVAPPVMVS